MGLSLYMPALVVTFLVVVAPAAARGMTPRVEQARSAQRHLPGAVVDVEHAALRAGVTADPPFEHSRLDANGVQDRGGGQAAEAPPTIAIGWWSVPVTGDPIFWRIPIMRLPRASRTMS